MKFFIISLMFVSISTFAGKGDYSKVRWYSYGSYAAIILAQEIDNGNSDFYGLVVECSPSKGRIRVTVKDLYAKPGDKIRWETNKKMGSILNRASMVIRTAENDIKLNENLINAIRNGTWIKFENITRESMAIYSLKGSSKAINSIVSCK